MSKFETSVVAMLTRHRAVGYFHAALDIVPRNSALEPKYFMFSHAIELTLKAYLMVNGYSVDFCRKLNHDLKKAMNLALSHQLSLSDQHQAIIASLSEQHNRPFFLSLLQPGWMVSHELPKRRAMLPPPAPERSGTNIQGERRHPPG